MGPVVADNFIKRDFDAYYCKTKEEALEKALSLIPKNHIVSWGGSASIKQIGLLDEVKNRHVVIDRDEAENPVEAMRNALHADTFLMSSNGASADGQLINIDGWGNRVAALCFGPRQVIVILGLNKVQKNIEDALEYARTVEAPLNCQRFESHVTPCNINGICIDCNVEDCCCNQIVHTRRSYPKNRIKVILVGQDLGL
jgi:hypothetical protein